MSTLANDLRYAVRLLTKAPGFAASVVVILAIAIGANTAVFTVVRAVLLRQLPFRDPGRLVAMWSRQTVRDKAPFNVPDFIDFRDGGSSAFDAMAGIGPWSANLTGSGEPERIQGVQASANVFEMFGVDAALGRPLVPADDGPGAARVVVLADGLWRRRFGADPAILGQTLTLDGSPYTVVGVLRPEFFFPVRDAELAVPLAPDLDPRRQVRGSVAFIRVVGRLKAGVTREDAEQRLTTIALRLQREHPDTNARKVAVRLVPLADEIVGSFRPALVALAAAVAIVLLIACANIANLMLARGTTRERELAVRLAMGATRTRLVAQLLTESAVLSLAGGAIGGAAAAPSVRALVALAPADLPRIGEIHVDGAVLLFTVVLSLFATMAFGTLPALLASHANPNEALTESGRGSTDGPGRQRARGALVAAEVAAALVLLVAGGLFARSFANLQSVEPGFDSAHLLSARISLPRGRFATRDRIVDYQRRTIDAVGAVPGVASVAAVSLVPLSGQMARVDFTIEGRAFARDSVPTSQYRIATPGYFRTMAIPIRRGREFSDQDTGATRPVAVVNETLANRFFADGAAVGQHLLIDDSDSGPRPVEIVGIVGNVKHLGLDADATFDVYLPYAQVHPDALFFATANMFWIVRGPSGVAATERQVRAAMQKVDPAVPIANLKPLDQYIAASIAPRRFNLVLIAIFAAAAAVLAATGIYAMLSYSVSQRAAELAIRSALGAQRSDLVWLVVRQGLRPVTIGTAAGLVAALVAARFVSALLFGLSAADPLTFGAVSAGVLAIGAAASIAPALRAARASHSRFA